MYYNFASISISNEQIKYSIKKLQFTEIKSNTVYLLVSNFLWYKCIYEDYFRPQFHYLWRSHDPMSRIWSIFFKKLIVFRLSLHGVFRFCVVFILFACCFIFASFFRHQFFRLFYGATQTDLDELGSCASRSDSLISLTYSMAVFSMKSFGLFLQESIYFMQRKILRSYLKILNGM